MVRMFKTYARQLVRLVLATSRGRPKAAVETEDGRMLSLDKSAVETVRRNVGRKQQGVLSPLDGHEAQSLLAAVERHRHVGDIFQVNLRGFTILCLIEADGLAFLTW